MFWLFWWIFWLVVDGVGYILAGGGQWWIYVRWCCWVMLGMFLLVLGGDGWWWVVVDGGIVKSNP